MSESTYTYRKRGLAQLVLTLFGQSIGVVGFILTGVFRDNALPTNWLVFTVGWFALGVLLHIGVRIALPWADPVILPVTLALTGLGLGMLHRLDLTSGESPSVPTQFLAVIIGAAALLIIAFILKDPCRLKGFPFLLSGLGFILLLLPLIPGLGTSIYGSRIWISIGGFSFQPAEIAKIVLAASFAAYLADKRDVLSSAGHRIIGVELPRMRDLGPIMLLWGLSLAIMVFENDLGTSLLFFGMFVMMIYVATAKVSWVVLGLLMFGIGGAAVIRFAGHVQTRIDYWLHPFDYPDDATQIIQAQFGLSHGGLFGSGWGLGRPDLTIFASSDMIAAAMGEEIGVVGLMAIVILYGLFVFRGLKTSLVATDPFLKLFTAGLSFAFLIQVFAIIGGVTRLLPLTGLTTPFLSQGGSAMIADWVLVALLLVISNQARSPHDEVAVLDQAGITGLADEHTQVFSTRELAQIGTGATHPVQRLDIEQIRLDPGGIAPVTTTTATPPPTPPTWGGSEEPTVFGSAAPATSDTIDAGSEVELDDLEATVAISGVTAPPAPTTTPGGDSPAPTPPSIPDDPFSDDYFGRGTD